MTEYLMPAKYARLILRVAQEQGYDVHELIEDAGLSFNPLELAPDESFEIPTLTFSKLFRRISDILQDEAFGLSTDFKVPPGTFRILCYTIIHCNTLRKAMDRATEFASMIYGFHGLNIKPMPPYKQQKGSDDATLVYSTAANLFNSDINLEKQLQIVNSLSMWHRFCCWLIGSQIIIKQVNLMGPPQNDFIGHRYFDCPVLFEQQENSLIVSASILDAPLVHNEDSLEAFLKTVPYQLLVIDEEQNCETVISRIRSVLGNNFTRSLPTFDEMAELLNISSRTLRRRLENEGTTYQKVKDECRRDAAIDYLNRSSLTINSVAALMGYDEPSAFHRSFKKWMGMTPGEFRRKQFT
ncbi:AraC family transcriptional regulator [uncultured Endozoicomonas sp.]|uniref:AraC family transcriptional regulator n=1 Tax=uncultured Endozoicomonas sp. TaxID=432652 RepID=UPI002609BE30|nr:AraC family transcriptional regulator [uncultured Endozoicomonas sp.]